MENWNGIISLLLACMELIFLVNVLIFADKNKLNIHAAVILSLLTLYQLIEYLICGIERQNPVTVYSAFAVISFLPPAVLHFHLSVFDKWNKIFGIIYLPAFLFTVYYGFNISKFVSSNCTIFYAVYNYPLGDLFGLFYYVPIITSIIILFIYRNKAADKKVRAAVIILAVTLIITSLPVIIAFTLKFAGYGKMLTAVESIMCKFAFVYALGLTIFSLLNSKDKNARNNT